MYGAGGTAAMGKSSDSDSSLKIEEDSSNLETYAAGLSFFEARVMQGHYHFPV
jgi:hypothetical protein